MYQNERWFKTASIILIVYGAFNMLGFLSLLVLSAAAIAVDLLGVTAQMAGVFFYVLLGVFNLTAGITGLMVLNRKGDERLVKVFGRILLFLSVLDLLYGLVVPPFTIRDITQPLIHIIIVCVYLKRGEKVLADHAISDMQRSEKEGDFPNKN